MHVLNCRINVAQTALEEQHAAAIANLDAEMSANLDAERSAHVSTRRHQLEAATGACPYNRPCAQQYVGKSQSRMV